MDIIKIEFEAGYLVLTDDNNQKTRYPIAPVLREEDIPATICRDTEADNKITNHVSIASAHHAKYTDGEAVDAINAALSMAFFAATKITKPSAYTQTYATADKTHSAETSADFPVGGTGTAAGGWDTAANTLSALNRVIAKSRDVANLKQLVNAIIDDLQALGLVG